MSSSTLRPRPFVAAVLAALAVVTTVAALWAGPATATESPDADPDQGPVVDILPVRGFLDPPVVRAMGRLIDQAQASPTSLVVLQVDGPGGISADIKGLLDRISTSEVPVVVFVSPQQGLAAQAGGAYGLLWASAHVRAISDVGTVGPVDPANLADAAGSGFEQGVVEASLGPDGAIILAEEVSAEALEEAGLVDVLAPNVAALLAELDGRTVTTAAGELTISLPRDDVEVRLHSLGLLSRLLHAAAAPVFIYLLLVVGLGMLAFELFQPGFGVAGFAGLIVLPFALFGLSVLPVTWWALALLLAGLALYSLDTALAGLGVTTAVATAAFGVGSWFLFGTGVLRVPPAMAILMTVGALVFFVVVMTVILRAQAGPEGVDVSDLVGRHGIVRSILNPEGHVYIDDALWRARVGDDGRLRVGTPVTVTGVDGAVLVVDQFRAGDDAPAADEVSSQSMGDTEAATSAE